MIRKKAAFILKEIPEVFVVMLGLRFEGLVGVWNLKSACGQPADGGLKDAILRICNGQPFTTSTGASMKMFMMGAHAPEEASSLRPAIGSREIIHVTVYYI